MKTFFTSLKLFLILTLITGVVYPLFITIIAQTVFPEKANGSLIIQNDKVIGSSLIGQQFDSTIYFSSRPSACSYNALSSGGSNYGLTNVKLKNLVETRKKEFICFNHLDSLSDVPSEMLFASASGLDPHISVESALLQADRIAKARHFNSNQKEKLIKKIETLTELPLFMCIGEKRINVLLLNLETDKIK